MNITEVRSILALLGTALDRQIPDGLDQIWAATLDDVPYEFGRLAALDVIKSSPFLPKVADIRHRVAELSRERQRVIREASEQRALEAYRAEAGPLTDRSAEIQEFVGRVRDVLPESDREALRPRAVAWERGHRAYQRQATAEPNLSYDPSMAPLREWNRDKCEPVGCWWEDAAARERHAKVLLAEAGRLAGRKPAHEEAS